MADRKQMKIWTVALIHRNQISNSHFGIARYDPVTNTTNIHAINLGEAGMDVIIRTTQVAQTKVFVTLQI